MFTIFFWENPKSSSLGFNDYKYVITYHIYLLQYEVKKLGWFAPKHHDAFNNQYFCLSKLSQYLSQTT